MKKYNVYFNIGFAGLMAEDEDKAYEKASLRLKEGLWDSVDCTEIEEDKY